MERKEIEEKILLFLDKEMNPEEEAAFVSFMETHPEYTPLLKTYASLQLDAETVYFTKKEKLLRSEKQPALWFGFITRPVALAASIIMIVFAVVAGKMIMSDHPEEQIVHHENEIIRPGSKKEVVSGFDKEEKKEGVPDESILHKGFAKATKQVEPATATEQREKEELFAREEIAAIRLHALQGITTVETARMEVDLKAVQLSETERKEWASLPAGRFQIDQLLLKEGQQIPFEQIRQLWTEKKEQWISLAHSFKEAEIRIQDQNLIISY